MLPLCGLRKLRRGICGQ
ncbi:hypothetical protein [Mucilaginibacter sp. SMC90]